MRALVTGAGSGIGQAIAATLAGNGYDVVATARDVATLESLEVASRYQLDVTDDASVAALVAAEPEIDVVVNNAGIVGGGPMERFPVAVLHQMFDTNVYGPVRLINAYAPGMRARGRGAVVNVTSVEGRVSAPLSGPYCATKHALEAISEALHYEMSRFGVRVVIIEPGYIAPGMKARPRHGEDAPYDELRAQLEGSDNRVLSGAARPGPELVGQVVLEALTTDAPKLRWPVGADAEMVLAARAQMDDASFEAAMRQVLDLSW